MVDPKKPPPRRPREPVDVQVLKQRQDPDATSDLEAGFAELEARLRRLESGISELALSKTRPRPIAKPVPQPPSEEGVAAPPPIRPTPRWTSPDAPSGRSWLALALVLAAELLLALGLVVVLRPLIGQDNTSTDASGDPAALAFDPPVDLPANASYVETTVLPSGDLEVTHWIHSNSALFSITLTAPQLDGRDSGKAVATGVVVAADGRVVDGAGTVDTMNQSYEFFGAKSIYVTYLLAGAIERSSSEDGRALARVTSLDVSYVSVRGTSTRSVEGATVLSMACSPAGQPDAVPEPCGAPEGTGWQVELSGENRDDRVMAQLELG
jgi:hypothetical protein